jgi:hypothetical protein
LVATARTSPWAPGSKLDGIGVTARLQAGAGAACAEASGSKATMEKRRIRKRGVRRAFI